MRGKIFFLLLSGFIFTQANLSALDFKEGNWIIEMQIKMEGMPIQMAPIKMEQCLSKKDMIPTQQGDNSECKVTHKNIKSSSVSWNIICSDSKGHGNITYKYKKLFGKMQVQTTGSGMQMKMNYDMKGTYKGPCKHRTLNKP